MKLYSAEWATRVYFSFIGLCTRAQQIDACICQTCRELYDDKLQRSDLQEILIRELRIPGNKTWAKYKRLVKSPVFSHEQLEEVSFLMNSLYWKVDVEKKQRQFQWD